jgi:nitrogenase molybdenum-iron protein alpha/beta subunit
MDAILGDDEKLLHKILSFTKDRKVPCIAIVGSPVPMVVGFDFEGFASLVEKETGIPTFGFSTNGLNLHDYGASDAYLHIAKRFVSREFASIPKGVNILGATALDGFDSLTISMLEHFLEAEGYDTISVWGSKSGIEDLRKAGSAQVNWVVSSGALPLAKWFEQNFGIPYVAGFPVGRTELERIRGGLASLTQGRSLGASVFPSIDTGIPTDGGTQGKNILITGEPLFALSLAAGISRECAGIRKVGAGGFFSTGLDATIPGWTTYATEDDARNKLNAPEWDLIAGDPLLRSIITKPSQGDRNERPFFPIAHRAVSGRLYDDSRSRFFGTEGINTINESIGGLYA